jgi:hypothetical protein
MLVSCLASSILKMEVTCSSETSVDSEQAQGIMKIGFFITTAVRTSIPATTNHFPYQTPDDNGLTEKPHADAKEPQITVSEHDPGVSFIEN